MKPQEDFGLLALPGEFDLNTGLKSRHFEAIRVYLRQLDLLSDAAKTPLSAPLSSRLFENRNSHQIAPQPLFDHQTRMSRCYCNIQSLIALQPKTRAIF